MIPRSRSYIDMEKVLRCIHSHNFSDNSYIKNFEASFARYTNARKCYATNQGRAALYMGLKALPIKVGDEVIIQSFTFPGVLDAILETGARPILVDNSLTDFNAQSKDIEGKISGRTKAIVATHLFGIPCNIEDIVNLGRERKIPVIEDCAQCLGGKYNGKNIGTFGDMAIFSFNFEKHLSTGEGGMLVVENEDLVAKVENILRLYQRAPLFQEQCYVYGLILLFLGTERDLYKTELSAYFGQDLCKNDKRFFSFFHNFMQTNPSQEDVTAEISPLIAQRIETETIPMRKTNVFRNLLSTAVEKINQKIHSPFKVDNPYLLMNSLRAEIGDIALKELDRINKVRNNNAADFSKHLQDEEYLTPSIDANKEPVHLKYNVILKKSKFPLSYISKEARENGFELRNQQWPYPLHTFPRFRTVFKQSHYQLPNSEYLAANILNLPIHFYIGKEDVLEIVNFLQRIQGNIKNSK